MENLTEKDLQFKQKANAIAKELQELVTEQDNAGIMSGAILVVASDLENDNTKSTMVFAQIGRGGKLVDCISEIINNKDTKVLHMLAIKDSLGI